MGRRRSILAFALLFVPAGIAAAGVASAAAGRWEVHAGTQWAGLASHGGGLPHHPALLPACRAGAGVAWGLSHRVSAHASIDYDQVVEDRTTDTGLQFFNGGRAYAVDANARTRFESVALPLTLRVGLGGSIGVHAGGRWRHLLRARRDLVFENRPLGVDFAPGRAAFAPQATIFELLSSEGRHDVTDVYRRDSAEWVVGLDRPWPVGTHELALAVDWSSGFQDLDRSTGVERRLDALGASLEWRW